MKFHHVFFGIFLTMLLSFSCHQTESTTDIESPDNLANVSYRRCSADTLQSYWIAVPASGDSAIKKPLIIAFDPHGDGKLAVNSLSGAVIKLGYMVAGSNVIRNGYENMENAFATLTGDIIKHYNVDRERMFAAGFSGGGRFAQILSQMYPGIQAVISIGAGSVFNQSAQPANKLPVLFLAGNEDFNYMEINNSIEILKSMGFQCYFLEFKGKHEWPPRPVMDEALLWFEFDDCRRNKNRKDDPLIRDYFDSIKVRAGKLEANGDVLRACQEYEKGIAFLSGLVNTKSLSKELESLKKSKVYNEQLEKRQYAHNLEIRLQQGYIQALNQKDTAWWRNEIRNLNRELQEETDPNINSALCRIKNFISMAAYSFCNESFRSNKLDRVLRLIDIYRIVDPENPDTYYFNALYYSASGQPDIAIEYFRQSVSKGFNDFKKAAEELPPEIYKAGLLKE
jgi:pimeloyl-ACP methyl ester carboxylesterase